MYDFVYFHTFKSLISLGLFDKPLISYVECTMMEENHERKERAAVANGQSNRGYEMGAAAIWNKSARSFKNP